MNRFDAHRPGRLTVLAALLAGLSAPALAGTQDLVISQLYGAGGNTGAVYKNDYVEIFNRGAAPVSLAGKYLQYAATGGSNWSVAVLPSTVTLQPGQFALMQLAGGSVGAVLPSADGSSTSINMAGAAGKIVLSTQATAYTAGTVNPAVTFPATVVDLVGFGPATTASETTPTPALSATTAARRVNACVDSDSNLADFEIVAPNPRNSASALTPCGGEPPAQPIALTCPASLTVGLGFSGSAALSATDPDSIVNNALITSTLVPGISLLGFTPATEDGGVASVSLAVSASTAAGVYPVVIDFSNNETQQKSCTVNVTVQGPFAVTKTIPQLQGSGATSPFANTTQTTEGVVTMVIPNSGFFIQDAAGDGDPSTSDGVFVFMSTTAHGLVAGDLARVTGTVTEYTPAGALSSYTEIKDTIQILNLSSGHSVTAANVSGLDQLERVEGMLVNFSTPLTVNGNAYLGDRGELTLSVGRRETPTNRYPAGSPEALAMALANAANEITLDDKLFVTPAAAPYIGADGTVRTGDTVTGLTGVVDFGALGSGGAGYKLQPTEAPIFSRSNAREAAPVIAAGNVRVASANVLNYFTTFTDGFDVVTGLANQGCKVGATTTKGNCRGADNLAEYTRQRDKIVAELKAIDADAVGLMEIQNNGDIAATALVDALNASIGFPVYAVVPAPPATGTDAIRVAMIYKPAALTLVGPAMSDNDAINNRPPMAQTFKHANGAKFSLIVNHLKSKASCPANNPGNLPNLDTNGQGCWNNTRLLQANRLSGSFIPQVVATAGDPDVLVIGDMNAHGFEDPINALTATGLVNELERFVRPHGIVYSYVFDGASGYLDHALASASLDSQVAGATEWHNNADEPTILDYNLDDNPKAPAADLYVNNAFRASDHDPVVISLNLTPTYFDATASFTVLKFAAQLNRATGKYTGKVTFKNNTASTINGPFHVTFSGLSAGVSIDNASGTQGGAPFITAGEASLAPGATGTVNVTFSNPGKVAIGYSNTIYRGNF